MLLYGRLDQEKGLLRMQQPSVPKKSFRHAVRIFKLLKKFENPYLLNAQGVLTPCTHSPLLCHRHLQRSYLTVWAVADATAPDGGKLLALFAVLALLVGDAAAGLAGRLARGLALAAAAVLGAVTQIAGIERLDMFHRCSLHISFA